MENAPMNVGGNSKAQIKAIVNRIEQLEREKKITSDDIRDVYAEAKGNGFDVKALRAIVRIRKQDAEKRREHEQIVDTYMNALGMLADTPLGQAAAARDLPDDTPRQADH
jgi:uncharacterized protein (UPF0335 family)